MKRYIIYIFIGLVTSGLISGCLPEKSETALLYKGPTVVEIKNQTLGQLATVLTPKGVYTTTSQTDSSRTVLLNTRGVDTILVQLVGPQRNTPTMINYSVRTTAPTGGTVATEGTHYDFIPAGARAVTIPPNSSFGYIRINVIPNSLTTVGTTRTVSVDLQGGSDALANPNYNKFILTLRR